MQRLRNFYRKLGYTLFLWNFIALGFNIPSPLFSPTASRHAPRLQTLTPSPDINKDLLNKISDVVNSKLKIIEDDFMIIPSNIVVLNNTAEY